MLKLDQALNKLNLPTTEGETIKGLPCDLCDKKHTRVVAVRVEDFIVWEIHSPCLDRLARLAARRLG